MSKKIMLVEDEANVRLGHGIALEPEAFTFPEADGAVDDLRATDSESLDLGYSTGWNAPPRRTNFRKGRADTHNLRLAVRAANKEDFWEL